MKILVIDDTQVNLQAAKQTLRGHELTLVATYDEAYKLLEKPRASYEAVEAKLVHRGFTKNPYDKSTTKEERKAHWEARQRLEVELCPLPPFDAVLCDLLMPAGREQQGDEALCRYVGQEMPVGWALALMAVLQGAKYVAVVTNLNHHAHPAAAMLDRLQSGRFHDDESAPVKFNINGVPVDFVNSSPMVPVDGTTCAECAGVGKHPERQCQPCYGSGKNRYGGGDCGCCAGSGRETPKCYACDCSGKVLGKDWGKVLARLLGQG